YMPFPHKLHVVKHKDSCHQHRYGYRKTVRSFHVTRFFKVKHNGYTTCPQNPVYTRDVDLPFYVSGEFYSYSWPKIKTHRFIYQCKRSTDQSLACNDGCRSGNDNTIDQKPVRHNFIKRIQFIQWFTTHNDPCTLTKIIEQ